MSTVNPLVTRIRQHIEKLAATTRQRGVKNHRLILQVKHHQLPRKRDEQNVPPLLGEGELRGIKWKGGSRGRRRGGGGRRSAGTVSLELNQFAGIGRNLKLLDDDGVLGVSEEDDRQEKAAEADGADAARIEGIAANAGEVFRRSVVFPNATSGGGVVERKSGRTVNRGEEVGIGAGLGPAEVLDALFGVGVEPEEGGLEAEIKERNAALAVSGSEEEVVGGGFGGEEVAAEGEGGPAEGGDEGRGGGRWRRDGEGGE